MNIERLFDYQGKIGDPQMLYTDIAWPEAPHHRPYVYINMASTADGKVVIGEDGGPSKGVGGPTDQILFRRLQQRCEAALTGSSTLRAGNVIYPPDVPRFTLTTSGDLDLQNRFFRDAPELAYVFTSLSLPADRVVAISDCATVVPMGQDRVDLNAALSFMRRELGIRVLLCEGGPTLNSQLFELGLVDELFLSVAPKIKGGVHASIVAGAGFPPYITAPLELLSVYRDADELYLRYRVTKMSDYSVKA